MKLTPKSHWSLRVVPMATCIFLLGITANGICAGTAVDSSKYVTRAEYEKVLSELAEIKAALGLQQEKSVQLSQETGETFDEYDEQFTSLREMAEPARSGTTKPLLTGWADMGYKNSDGQNSTFSASFNPIMLWQLGDRIFFEGELEFELDGNITATSLEYANMSYIVADFMTIKAGLFLTPFGTYSDRLHPGWINKLPDAPLAFGHGGLTPTSSLGFQASGGIQAGPTKFNYSLYVSNGPRLNSGDDEPGEAGLLHFDNYGDLNDGKAVGGRVGFLPIPALEIGYSFLQSSVDPEDNIDALLQAIDLGYVRDVNALYGSVDLRAQWVWSSVDDTIYDEDGGLGFGPLAFDNNRDGGYLQFAYRPSKVAVEFFKNTEAVVRWDAINNPVGAPEPDDQDRWTFGLNYWLSPSTVVKAAYQNSTIDSPEEGSSSSDTFLFQAAMGF